MKYFWLTLAFIVGAFICELTAHAAPPPGIFYLPLPIGVSDSAYFELYDKNGPTGQYVAVDINPLIAADHNSPLIITYYDLFAARWFAPGTNVPLSILDSEMPQTNISPPYEYDHDSNPVTPDATVYFTGNTVAQTQLVDELCYYQDDLTGTYTLEWKPTGGSGDDE